MQKTKWDKYKINNKTDLDPTISRITLNVNLLNIPIKSYNRTDKKASSTIYCQQESHIKDRLR